MHTCISTRNVIAIVNLKLNKKLLKSNYQIVKFNDKIQMMKNLRL